MQLIEAEKKHLGELVRISKEAFESDILVGGTLGDVSPGYDSLSWYTEMMESGNLFAAAREDKVVGGAVIFPNDKEKTVYIGRIFVDPIEFKKGFGIEIMKQIEEMHADASGFFLDTPIWNVRTNHFYTKLGYLEEKKEDGFVYYKKEG